MLHHVDTPLLLLSFNQVARNSNSILHVALALRHDSFLVLFDNFLLGQESLHVRVLWIIPFYTVPVSKKKLTRAGVCSPSSLFLARICFNRTLNAKVSASWRYVCILGSRLHAFGLHSNYIVGVLHVASNLLLASCALLCVHVLFDF